MSFRRNAFNAGALLLINQHLQQLFGGKPDAPLMSFIITPAEPRIRVRSAQLFLPQPPPLFRQLFYLSGARRAHSARAYKLDDALQFITVEPRPVRLAHINDDA